MKHILLCLVVFVAAEVAHSGIYLSTCARMDVPMLEKAARAACIASCSAQNCGTGYCEEREGRKTCVCSRCASGGNVPLDGILSITPMTALEGHNRYDITK